MIRSLREIVKFAADYNVGLRGFGEFTINGNTK